jgi:hypothetical protein
VTLLAIVIARARTEVSLCGRFSFKKKAKQDAMGEASWVYRRHGDVFLFLRSLGWMISDECSRKNIDVI